jgi:hypothetical protein
VVIALSDIGKRKHPERIERRCSFTQAAAPRWRLIEDESKSAVLLRVPDDNDMKRTSRRKNWAYQSVTYHSPS